MIQPGRKYSAGTGYRYGFNGKENDDEHSGEGNKLDYGARVYDCRIGKWLSVDPLFREYSHITPYAFMSGDPMNRVDPTGMGDYYSRDGKRLGSDGKTVSVTTGKGKNAKTKQVSDDLAYVTSQETINQFTVDGKTDWDKVIANSNTTKLNISNSVLNNFANTIIEESSGDRTESYALASTIVNLSKHGEKSIINTLKTEGIYGYSKGDGRSTAYNANKEFSMEAAINALTGGIDYSNGAFRWDGYDLAGRGLGHIKPTTYGVQISIAHKIAFKNAWPDAVLKAYSSGQFTQFSPNFYSGIHKATGDQYKGRCLLISTAVHGRTMFWGINRDPVIITMTQPAASAPLHILTNFVPEVINTVRPNAGFKNWKDL